MLKFCMSQYNKQIKILDEYLAILLNSILNAIPNKTLHGLLDEGVHEGQNEVLV